MTLAACDGDDTSLPSSSTDAGGDVVGSDTGPDSTAGGVDGSDGAAASADGGNDLDGAMVVDGGGEASTDAGVDAAPPPKLSCTTWKYASPIVIEDLTTAEAGGAVTYDGRLWVGEPMAGSVRVIGHPSVGPLVSRLRVRQIHQRDLDALDSPAAAQRTRARTTSAPSRALQRPRSSSRSSPLSANSYLLPDALPMSGPLPPARPISPSGYSFAALPFDSMNTFAVAAYQALFTPPGDQLTRWALA